MDSDSNDIGSYNIVVPSTMRSLYWTYFGFPADESNNIVTKTKVVCTICGKLIAYNKNTSNLRTHLVAKHPELLFRIQQEIKRKNCNSISAGGGKSDKSNSIDENSRISGRNNKRKRIKIEKLDILEATRESSDVDEINLNAIVSNNSTMICRNNKDSSTKYSCMKKFKITPPAVKKSLGTISSSECITKSEPIVFKISNISDSVSVPIIEAIPAATSSTSGFSNNSNTNVEKCDKNTDSDDDDNYNEHDCQVYVNQLEHEEYEIEEIENNNLKSDEVNYLEIVQNLCVKDLLQPSNICGPGFENILNVLSGGGTSNYGISKDEINLYLMTLYREKHSAIYEKLPNTLLHEEFCIGIEMWENIEKKIFISIYVNFLIDDPIDLKSVLYKTIKFSKDINWENVLKGINLKNCTSAVLNTKEESIQNFFTTQEIPIVPCFDTILNQCLLKVFEMPSVIELFSQIKECLEKSSDNFEEIEMPESVDALPWSKFDIVKRLCENPFWASEASDLIAKVRGINECFSPLKNCLETLIDEPLPLSTLIKPLTAKLLEEHLTLNEFDFDIILETKEIIINELSKSILHNDYLMENTFFDPRFTSFLKSDEQKKIQSNLMKKFCKTITNATEGGGVSHEKKIHIKNELQHNINNDAKRRSSLKMFFNYPENKLNATKCSNSLEIEITKYINETVVDLEQCPISWWNENSLTYRNLRKLSKKYLCTPCCVNLNFFNKDQENKIEYYYKRMSLREKYANILWFLHYNQDLEL